MIQKILSKTSKNCTSFENNWLKVLDFKFSFERVMRSNNVRYIKVYFYLSFEAVNTFIVSNSMFFVIILF